MPSRHTPRPSGSRRLHSTVPPRRSSSHRLSDSMAKTATTASRTAARTSPTFSARYPPTPLCFPPRRSVRSDFLAGRSQPCPRAARGRGGVVAVFAGSTFVLLAGGGNVDLAAQLGVFGQQRHLIGGDGQEAAGDHRSDGLTLRRIDADDAAIHHNAEHGRVTGQDADLTVECPGQDHIGLARPELAFG